MGKMIMGKIAERLHHPKRDEIETLLEDINEWQDVLQEVLDACSVSAPAAQPLRCIHHFACTGGTLITKAIAAMPNTVVMSEIDPLSTLHLRNPQQPFIPTDLIAGLRYSPREIGEDTLIAGFSASLRALKYGLTRQGFYLVLRDHAHSQFCTAQDRFSRPTLHALLNAVAAEHEPNSCAVHGVVTARHPLESYMSLQHNGWMHFSPATLEEYSRRYLDFLDRHRDLPLIRYETFVRDPDATTKEICHRLALPFDPHFETLMPLTRLSGDSGRTSRGISSRPRRAVGPDLQQQADQSQSYQKLCEWLEYDF